MDVKDVAEAHLIDFTLPEAAGMINEGLISPTHRTFTYSVTYIRGSN